MTIPLNDLGGGYPTFPQFQQMLREYEARTPAVIHADNNQADAAYQYPNWKPPVVDVKDGARIYPNWNRMPR